MRTIRTDVAVIGAGTAGLSAYRSAKAEGRTAVIIEGGEYGTTYARVGCTPSKLLIAAAEAAHAASHAGPFGVRVEGVRVDGKAIMERVRSERDRFVVDGVYALPEADRGSISDDRGRPSPRERIGRPDFCTSCGNRFHLPGTVFTFRGTRQR